MRLILSIIGLGLLMMGCGGGDKGELVLALKPDKDPDAMLEERGALTEYLEGVLGRPVTVVVPTSGSVIEQGLENGTVDLAWVASTSLARYRENGAAELLLAGEVDGRTWYESYWVARSGSGYDGVEDLRGQRIAFASPTSTSGYVIPLYDLKQRGLVDANSGAEGFFGEGNVGFGTGYVSAILQVLEGGAQAAAVSDYVMNADKHLDAGQKAQLEVIARQGPVPTHCLAVRGSLDEEEKAQLLQAFLQMESERPDLTLRLFSGPLKEVDADEHLRPIEEALEFARQVR